ncbi:carbon-nitrogen hydrolase family protein [Alkalihalophilus marmarensis]|jgi:predicted amidohydrolase|uniref:CN hydrolase domain-containing protein n=1 Tax=Alkalihalophilus marmarensis DSM 21297 TaxID=1188261 RepID=U6SSR6_9BACI|nr:carbon-nitrogen hydrolase family protein [Alkalihalophilus marmarensis]ERN54382.1 hypothetical protein A33I_08155 [Alkalihalophilus marmarensis DSM 21297]MCM3488245.1 carbon-nitrogen hydrolase family protein [Alkalihalophilus marmarensis]
MKSECTIAAIQTSFSQDIHVNLKSMKEHINSCVKKQPEVQLIVFPELSLTGYYLSQHVKEAALTHDSPVLKEVAGLAAEHKIYLAFGYVELGEDKRIYNSIQLITPTGRCIANYRKIHLTKLEKEFFTAGNEVVTVETEIGKIGLMICWDLAFPELARMHALNDADIMIAPSAWEVPFDKPFQHFGVSRAIDNSVFLVAVNHIGNSDELEFFGQSAIYGPDGEAITRSLNNQEDILYAKLLFNEREKLKQTFFSMLNERRTDLYGT